MPRVKRGKRHLQRRKKLFKKTKGYKWGRKNTIKLGNVAVLKAGVHAYRHRRKKKRENRALWQVRINAGCRRYGLSYSKFMGLLRKANIELNRKMLSDLALNHPLIFKKVVEEVKK